MGFFGALGSVLSSVGGAISSAVGSIGGALAGYAGTFLKVAAPYLGAVLQVVQIVASLLGVLKPDEKPEELGDRALNADKKPEDFDSNAEYIEYLRNEVEFDQEKFDKLSDGEKTARGVVGASIAIKGIEEQKGFEIPMQTWVSFAKLGFEDKAKEIDAIFDIFKGEKLNDFNAYVEGKLDAKKEIEVGDTLVKMYKNIDPGLSEEHIEEKVMNMDRRGEK